jgi:hypothetical protein
LKLTFQYTKKFTLYLTENTHILHHKHLPVNAIQGNNQCSLSESRKVYTIEENTEALRVRARAKRLYNCTLESLNLPLNS